MRERSFHKFTWFELGALVSLLAFVLLGVPTPHSTAQQDNRQLKRDQAQQTNGSSKRRIALVIGNGAYTKAPPLKNPPNDARDMAATLRLLDFSVSSAPSMLINAP